jgi:AmmeMemoRadiSam system protein B/AmmeMemoRadiSam system protein A
MISLQAAQCNSDKNNNARLFYKSLNAMPGDTIIDRKPAVAGTFYSASREALMKQLEIHFKDATPDKKLGHIAAVIVPHAGYVYSGTVAASAYSQLSPSIVYDNIFIIGSSHQVAFEGASIYADGNFITPLGTAKVNTALAKKIITENPGVFQSFPSAHTNEHSLEVQVPFLQYLYRDNLKIIPIILGTQKQNTCRKIAEALRPYFNEKNLFVISTDFSHYPDYENATRVDAITADAILQNSPDAFIKTINSLEREEISNLATCICGWTSMLTLLDITEKTSGVQYHKIRYMNSGDASFGDKNRVVGYNAMIATRPVEQNMQHEDNYSLTDAEKEQLLALARNAIKSYLETGKEPKVDPQSLPVKLLAPAGAFVTLNKDGELRGCIGQFSPQDPLYKVVQSMAIAAATRDYRFPRVTLNELRSVKLEISVLTPMRRVQSIDEIVLGKHGIYIKKGSRAGTFLPQVATQTNWNLEEFLGHCSQDKAGIGWNGWKDAEIYIYEAYVFGED